MEKNKTGKYLKYAIGEIVLVVIGILIALQINNWNENRKDHAQERELLTQLQSEFQSNLEQLDRKIVLRNNMISASLKLLDYVDHPEKRNSDSIIKYIGPTMLAPTFDPIVNDIISSGRIQLLRNYNLKEKLSRLTSEIIQVTEEEVGWRDYRPKYRSTLLKYSSTRTIINQYWKNNVVESFLLDKGTKTELDIKNSKKNMDVSNLLDNSNFEDHVANCVSFAKLTNSQSMSLRKRIVEILELIEQGLKK
jgi:hypothetical protein